MIYENQQISSNKIACLECGNAVTNYLPSSSAFMRYACQNDDCDMKGVAVTIEKCSNIVFSTNPPYSFEGKPAWPEMRLVDRDNKVVWPKAERHV